MDNWDRLKIVQKIPDQYTWTARQQGTTDNRHIGHCAHRATSENTNVKVQNVCHGK